MEYIDQHNMILIEFITHSFTSMHKIEVSTGNESKHLEEVEHLHVSHSCDKARKTSISTKPKTTHPNPDGDTTIFPTRQFLIRERKNTGNLCIACRCHIASYPKEQSVVQEPGS